MLDAFITCLAFSFSCSRDHRDLHSFPTRRSSDLRRDLPWRRLDVAAVDPGLHADRAERGLRDRAPELDVRAQRRPRSRSEEHTSELQSPYDLVCRLLLEKKKKKISSRAIKTANKF